MLVQPERRFSRRKVPFHNGRVGTGWYEEEAPIGETLYRKLRAELGVEPSIINQEVEEAAKI